MADSTSSVHSYLEHRALTAMRALEPQKQLEMATVLEAMASAFPARRPASLTLASSNDHPVQNARSLTAFKLVSGSRS